jgi:hypothetical protein
MPDGGRGILDDLRRLDDLLKHAADQVQIAFGPQAVADPFRGLYVTPAQVEELLQGASQDVPATPKALAAVLPAAAAWGRLAGAFDLEGFDTAVALIALAPELESRYERIYAFLHDDVTRRRPTVGLCLSLLCGSAAERLARRRHFEADAPLVREGLVHLVSDPNEFEAPLVSRDVVLDERVVAFLLERDELDPRLSACARLLNRHIESEALPSRRVDGLANLARRALSRGEGLALHFHNGEGVDGRAAALTLAGRLGAPLLTVDLEEVLDTDPNLTDLPAVALREARLRRAVVYLDHAELLRDSARASAARRLRAALGRQPLVVVVADSTGRRNPVAPKALPVDLQPPTHALRRTEWSAALEVEGLAASTSELDALAGRYRLTPERIRQAARSAREACEADGGEGHGPDLFGAARDQSSADLGAQARRLATRYRWDDLVLPPERLSQLAEICNTVRHRSRVYEQWGFDGKLSFGKGVNILFTGPSGTGKTMAAEVLAGELEFDLYRIDLSMVVSKYVGETEKNLARVFEEAELSTAILFFDEADALFGKRSQVRDAHDRYANIEVSYLLQRMEEYNGIAILATNLQKNMDEAFLRRMHFSVAFPFPSEAYRLRIWEGVWPTAVPRDRSVDPSVLAERFELPGGAIRNIALAAAFLAAADGRVITMDHILHATRRELEKMGTVITEGEFRGVL